MRLVCYNFQRVERKNADFIEKLPAGKHSCMGIGKTKPDPAASLFVEDKVEVPLGKPVPSNIDDTTLLYNEYPFFFNFTVYLFLLLQFAYVYFFVSFYNCNSIDVCKFSLTIFPSRFIVYDISQVKLCYLVKVDFNFDY